MGRSQPQGPRRPRPPPPPSFNRPRNNPPYQSQYSPSSPPYRGPRPNPSQNQFLGRNAPGGPRGLRGVHARSSLPSHNGHGPSSQISLQSSPWFHGDPAQFNLWEQARPTPALDNSFNGSPPLDFYSARQSPIPFSSGPLGHEARAGPSRPIPRQEQFPSPAAAIARPGNPGYFMSHFQNPNIPTHNPFDFENEAPGPQGSYPELCGLLNKNPGLRAVFGDPGPSVVHPYPNANCQISHSAPPAQHFGLLSPQQPQVLRERASNTKPIPMVGVRGGAGVRVQKFKNRGNRVGRQFKKFGCGLLAPCFGGARRNSDSGFAYSSQSEPSTPIYRNPTGVPAPEPEEYDTNYPLPRKLYHYTNKAGAEGILADGYLRVSAEGMSSPNLEKLTPNARHGTGIYFSVLPPETPTAEILRNNYGLTTNNRFDDRADYCFEFKSQFIPEIKGPMLYDSMTGHPLVGRGRSRLIWKTKVHKFFLNKELPGNVGVYYRRLGEPGDREESNQKKPKQVIHLKWQFKYDERE